MNNLTNLLQNIQTKSGGSDSETCQPTTDEHAYNLTLRIVSIFVLLVVSLLGALIAVLSAKFEKLRIPPVVINIGKFFGIGVILATALIHIIPAATRALTDSCLSGGWKDYEAYAGLFTMVAILFMQLIEFLAHHLLHGASEEVKQDSVEAPSKKSVGAPVEAFTETGHSHGLSLLKTSRTHRVTTYLLEFGIAIHSILVGITLGTDDGSNFVALFIALCFHQFFEGIALGSQISKLDHKSILPAIFLVAIFAVTTPIGVAIGIGIHLRTYNPKSVAALVSTGVLDAVSGGILLYIAMIDLMAGEMGTGAHEFFALKMWLKVVYFISMYLGAALMAVLARWA